MTNGLTRFIADIQRHFFIAFLFKVVFDDRTIRGVLTGWFIRRQRSVRVHVPSYAVSIGGLIKHYVMFSLCFCNLPQRGHIIQDPERAAMSSNYKVVIFYHKVTDRRCRHIHPQRLPVVSIVKRYIYGTLRSCKQ